MSNTLKLGNGKWATGKDTVLSFSDTNNNYKPLPFSFSRASSGTIVNKDGLIETVGSGEPRIDFNDNTKGALLLEPSRTNLLPYSEDYSQSVFTRRNCTINQNYAISPSGLLDATLVSANGSDAAIFDNIGVTSGNTYTLSVYLRVESGTLDTTLSLGSAGFPNTSGDGGRVKDITITTEWKRFTLTSTADANAGSDIGIIGGFGGFNNGDSVLIYAAQLEVGSYPTSYIPTSGQANGVTRVVDNITQTTPNLSNSQEVTAFIDLGARPLTGSNSTGDAIEFYFTSNNRIIYNQNGSSKHRIEINTDGNSTRNYYSTNTFSTTPIKIAIAVTQSTLKIYTNRGDSWNVPIEGVADWSNLSLVKTLITQSIGNIKINDLKFYNTALTDQELQALTQ